MEITQHVSKSLNSSEGECVSIDVIGEQITHDIQTTLSSDWTQMRTTQDLTESIQNWLTIAIITEEVS